MSEELVEKEIVKLTTPVKKVFTPFGADYIDRFSPPTIEGTFLLKSLTIKAKRRLAHLATHIGRCEYLNREIAFAAVSAGKAVFEQSDYSDLVEEQDQLLVACIVGIEGINRADGSPATPADWDSFHTSVQLSVIERIRVLSGLSEDEKTSFT